MNSQHSIPRILPSGLLAVLLALLSSCGTGPTVEARQRGSGLPVAAGNPRKTKAAAPSKSPSKTKQTPKSGNAAKNPPSTSKELVFDEVLAIVDANVVTRSSIRDDAELEILARQRELASQQTGAKLRPSEIAAIERGLVQARVRNLLLSDSIDTLGLDPARIEQTVQRYLNARLAEQEKEAGGALDFLERLKQRGTTYENHKKELRASIRRQISVSQKMQKADTGSQLLATPAQLLAYYRKHAKLFTKPAHANLRILRFASGQADPKQRAAQARKRLLQGETAAAVAKATQAELQELPNIRPDGSELSLLRDFAFDAAQKPGAVSQPIARGREVWLIQLVGRETAHTEPFTDEAVQNRIRAALARTRQNEFMMELFLEEQRRTQIWPLDLFHKLN